MIIMKFGGTSVRNATALTQVSKIIQAHLSQHPVVVVSAMAGITNLLEESVRVAVAQETENVSGLIEKIEKQHLEVIKELGIESDGLIADIMAEIKRLNSLLRATETIKVKSSDLSHAVLSIGEILSSLILTGIFQKDGIDAIYIDARKIMITTNRQDQIVPVVNLIEEKAREHLLPALNEHQLIVTQGFISATSEGAPTTLGRNGSDFSASLLGAAIDASEIQIWTDVDGILTADPTIIPYAKPLELMTFDEASELAYFGARVLYPAAIQPALDKGIPVRVLNSQKPESPGTIIVNKTTEPGKRLVKSIAYKENITLLTIKSSQLLLSTRLLSEFFQHLSEHDMRVYAVSKSAIKLSLTLEHSAHIDHLLKSFNQTTSTKIERHKAIVSVVGERMKGNQDIAWQIMRILREANIHLDLISQFASQLSFMFIINEADIKKTVELLHRELIENDFLG